MRFLIFVLLSFLPLQVFACDGSISYKAELEIAGKNYGELNVKSCDDELAKAEKTVDEVKTGFEVLPKMTKDEKGLKMQIKVFQTKGRESLFSKNFTLVARFDEAAEMHMDANPQRKDDKPFTMKVTAHLQKQGS